MKKNMGKGWEGVSAAAPPEGGRKERKEIL